MPIAVAILATLFVFQRFGTAVKVVSGGWFPLVIAALIFGVMMTWRRGRDVVEGDRAQEEGSLLDFVLELEGSPEPPVRVPGTAIFLNADATKTPLAMRYNVEHNRVLHRDVVVVSVETARVPFVPDAERFELDTLVIPDDGISLVKLRFGFQDEPDVPKALRLIPPQELEVDVDAATWFLSRVTVAPTRPDGMIGPRKRLFAVMNRNAAGRVEYFGLPEERTVSFGSQIEA